MDVIDHVLQLCKVCEDITKPIAYKGMCRNCYDRDLRERRRNGEAPLRRKPKNNAICKVCGDPDRPQASLGMCKRCYSKHLYHSRKRNGQNNVDHNAVPGASYGLAQHGSSFGAEELGCAGPGEPAAGDAAHGPDTSATGVVKRVVPVAHEVTALQWGPSWNDMLEAAEWLGSHGYMFTIKYASDEERRRGVEIFPELRLMDSQYRTHVVTHGLWIVAHHDRQFRVVTTSQLLHDYREAS